MAFEKPCQSLVIQRMIEQSDDYRLDPALYHSCQVDINLYCNQILAKLSPESEYNGKVLHCLKVWLNFITFIINLKINYEY